MQGSIHYSVPLMMVMAMSDLSTQVQLLVSGELKYWATQICYQVEMKWDSKILPQNDGVRQIETDTMMVSEGIVSIDLVASGMAAWIAEYGSGHLMDNMNPYLKQYMSSKYWNPERVFDGNEFIGRAYGDEVYGLQDGVDHISTGRMEGFRLEHATKSRAASGRILEAYEAAPPMHIIKEEIEATMPIAIKEINQKVCALVGRTVFSTISSNFIF